MVANTPTRAPSSTHTPTRTNQRTARDDPASSPSVSANLALDLDFSQLHLGDDNTGYPATPVAVNATVRTELGEASNRLVLCASCSLHPTGQQQTSAFSTNFNINVTVNGRAPSAGNATTPDGQIAAAANGPVLRIPGPAATAHATAPAPTNGQTNGIVVNERGFVSDPDLGTSRRWYSVTKGVKIGFFRSWSRTEPQVKIRNVIRPGACWSKHDSRELAEADFMENFNIGNVNLL
ncbi:hypothetical protein EIP91_011185 [Steccherinum ochraceum]|uniref:Uncharacterized protein n=1 Tax=Steccherinum ochraceum TaxID=92696 RepID=A0A4R0RBQ9_9APHY|nr:hypothetical protein EIP91_011185 [Steccherinum ochraceum]